MKPIHWIILFAVFFSIGFFQQELMGLFNSHPMDKLISDKAVEKAVPFTIYDTEIQEGKNINGGIYVQGSVKVPFNITWEAVKPTALAALRQLKTQKPESKWFKAYLIPEGKAGEALQVYVAITEFVNDQIKINYTILSPAEMTKLVERINNGEKVPDIPAFLTEKHFTAAAMISFAYNKFFKETHDPDSAYEQAAGPLGSTPEKIKRLRTQAMNYYVYGQEQEIIQ